MGADGEESGDDAYKMVHAHMIAEGRIDEDIEYDDWLCSASTWYVDYEICMNLISRKKL